jgi:pimeloyl-ACP methyl ester carboxylesterase
MILSETSVTLPTEPSTAASLEFLKSVERLPSKLSSAEIEKLRTLDLVFIPGFLNKAGRDPSLTNFPEQREWLQSQGIESTLITYDPDENERSLFELYNQIRSIQMSGRKSLIISHSMGSLLFVQLLITYPSLQGHIGGWISMNGTIHGTPLADLALKSVGVALPKKLKAALKDQTLLNAQAFVDTHRQEIEILLSQFPNVFAITWRTPHGKSQPPYLNLTGRILRMQGVQWNDGMVPTEGGQLGCPENCVIIPETGHFEMPSSPQVLRSLIHRILNSTQSTDMQNFN